LDSPAKLSGELAALFPAGVVAAELTEPAPRTVLTAAEFQFIAHCAEKRIDDFTRGRACAQRALRELGIEGFSLLAGKDREPLWPDSIVGSITHTGGYAAAVVARGVDIRGIGLDCELIASVDEDLWSRICTPAEQARLAQLPSAERGRQAALIFAAKEAFYKCQFPLTREWVGFEDVVIEPAEWLAHIGPARIGPASAGSLRILPQKTLPLEASQVAALVSRFQFRDPWVIAGVTTAS
jgi:enterobactin synthetase component D / holo-[acyl-carrier protein] synthase